MTIPSWVPDSVFYQIFPDRFAKGDPSLTPPNVQQWGSPPTNSGFQGGDLRGIMQHFDYLLDLGINALYLNPIFQSSSNHRYNTYDYYKVDPKLGDLTVFKEFLKLAHINNVHVIIDGVFNHCGRGFFAFNDLLENGINSPYLDWFHTTTFPLDAYTPGDARYYEAWWKLKSLPKFNTKNNFVRKYLFEVARYWIAQGVDGWRLDVPNEIDDDSFWEEFRSVVLQANNDAYLLGEIWTLDPRWVNDKHFDGIMNYPLREMILQIFHGEMNELQLNMKDIENLIEAYPEENRTSMYSVLGTHDTERLFTNLECSTQKAKLAYFLQFSFPGVPGIYYGDEVGLQGEKDPDCRRSFLWDQSTWNLELRYWIKFLISLRKQSAGLRRGKFQFIEITNSNGTYIFSRGMGADAIIVAANFNNLPQHIEIPVTEIGWKDGRRITDLFSNQKSYVIGQKLPIDLPPMCGTWLA
jgi:glycosidase